jgi:hypothetical protein
MPLYVTTKAIGLVNASTKYIFHGSGNGLIEENELVSLMTEYNSTLTEADISACFRCMLAVMKIQLADGKIVRTPFGLFRAAAAGNAPTRNTEFTPKTGENNCRVYLNLTVDSDFEKAVAERIKIESATWQDSQAPLITGIVTSGHSDTLTAASGESLCISGKNLAVDMTDSKQGVFFVKDENEQTRAMQPDYNTYSKLIVRVPDGLTVGSYAIKIVTAANKTSTKAHTAATFEHLYTITA